MIKINSTTIKASEINCGNINLILGTNNSGKSTFIHELNDSLLNGEAQEKNVWIDKIKLSFSDIKNEFDSLFPNVSDSPSFQSVSDFNKLGLQNVYGATNWNELVFNEIRDKGNVSSQYEITKLPRKDAPFEYYRFIMGLKTLMEDCSNRLSGPFNATINRIMDPYSNIVHFLYVKEKIFSKISKHIKDVFKFDITFDDLMQGEKEIRTKPITKIKKEDKKELEKYVKFWEENSKGIGSQGDGIKAYLKICYALFNPAKNIILIDEPETFLHPPQRRNLGQFIAKNKKFRKQLFIATHDSEVVRGILSSPSKNNVKVFHFRNINNKFSFVCNESNKFSDSRRLNETTLNSFFHKTTVLCEAEDDRMIYQYVAEKYYSALSADFNFIGYNGKPEVIKNLEILRKLELNVCCIYDVDALYSNEIFDNSVGLSEAEASFVQKATSQLKELLKIGKKDSQKENFKMKGVSFIHDQLAKKIKRCIAILASHGVFIIENGCLESWTGIKKSEEKKVQSMINEINLSKSQKLKFFIKKVVNF